MRHHKFLVLPWSQQGPSCACVFSIICVSSVNFLAHTHQESQTLLFSNFPLPIPFPNPCNSFTTYLEKSRSIIHFLFFSQHNDTYPRPVFPSSVCLSGLRIPSPPNTSLIILGPLPSLSHFYEFELLEYRSLRALSVVFTKFLAPSKYSVIIINEYVNHSLSLASSVSIQMLSS